MLDSHSDADDRQARLDRFERVLTRVFEQAQQQDVEHRAAVILRDVGRELHQAGAALDAAAYALREAGKGHEASQAKQAALRAHEQARGLVGD